MKRLLPICLIVVMMLTACGGDAKKKKKETGTNDPLTGAHLVVDVVGDTKDSLNAVGKKPENPLGSADILGIRMDGDGTILRIRIAIGQFPLDRLPNDALKGPAWFLQVWKTKEQKGAPAFFIAIVREGTPKRVGDRAEGWRLSVCKGSDVCSDPAAGATLAIVGTEVRADVPFALMPGLKNPFSWAALSYWNDTLDPVKAWSDWVPDMARPAGGPTSYPEPDTRAIFPSPKKKT